MRKRLSFLPALLVAATAAFVGCSSSTGPSTTPSSSVSFAKNAQFGYTEQRRDTNNSANGYDKIDANSTDSVQSTVIDTNATAYGKTNVVVIYNKRQRNPDDTTYIWQDGQGNFYRYNFGVDMLNNIPVVVGALGHRLEVGWILQAKMSGSNGAGWIAGRDTEYVSVGGIPATAYISDSAQRMGDTTITVKGSAVSCVHTLHTITLMLATAKASTVYIDNYESKSYGEVRNTVHSFSISVPFFASAQISGQERMMVSHP